MDIDQLLKSKSPKEKMDFLNSMRCKVTTKLKTTDEYKISEVVLLVNEFIYALAVNHNCIFSGATNIASAANKVCE